MALSNDLISQFVKATQDKETTKKESTAYGKIVKKGDAEYVQLDGSDLLTPIQSTTVVRDGDRVIVTIKNHTAIVTGDFTNPSANNEDIKELGTKISEFEIIIADKVSTEQLEAEIAKIDQLIAGDVSAIHAEIETINGKVAEIDTIKADIVEVEEKITAHEGEFTTIRGEIADFENVTTESIEAIDGDFRTLESDYADFKVTTTDKLSANEASIEDLETKKLDAETASVTYATIDFSNIGEAAIEKIFSDSGIIEDLIISDGKVTGELVGVTIKGDLIEGNTVKADKLVILGEDGIYYKLNVDALGEATASSDEKYQNGLDGSIIIAKSITADRVAVTDLVAFGATIGGFNITDHALYSGVKSSIDNTTDGVFLGDDGQISVGNVNNYLKFFIDENGEYKLEIQADILKLSSGKTVEETIIENNTLIKDFEGENITLTDSGKGTFIDFSMKGKTEHEIRNELKNIFNKNNEINASTNNPNKVVLDTGVRIISTQTLTNSSYIRVIMKLGDLSELVGKTIRIKTTAIPSASYLIPAITYALVSSDPWNVSTDIHTNNLNAGVSGDLELEHVVCETGHTECNNVCLILYTTYDGSNITVNQGDYVDYTNLIVTVDNEDLTYEPYGIKPSPDNPSPIETVEGNVEIKVTGKNLLPYPFANSTISSYGITFTDNEDGTITVNGTATGDAYIALQTDIDYGEIIDGSSNATNGAYAVPKTSIDTAYMYYNTTNKILYLNVNSGVTINNLLFKPQIEKGTVATDYEPYEEQTIYFPLAEGQKLMEGSYLADDGIHHKKKQVVFDGSDDETWFLSVSQDINIFYIDLDIPALTGGTNTTTALCNYYQYDFGYIDDRFYISSDATKLFINDNSFSTVVEFKTWLTENPITVEYELAEEETISYTEDQQTAWDKLQNLQTYKHITNISSKNTLNPIFYGRYCTHASDEMNTIINNETTNIRTEMQTNTTNILKNTQNIIFEALSEYVTTGDLEVLKETISTQFQQTSESFTFLFNNTMTEINNVNNETQTQFQEIQKYIKFIDGNIILGENENELTLKIQNDRIAFLQNNSEVAYFSNDKLYVTDGEFLNSLQIGKFIFKPRSNGSLSFIKSKSQEV